MAKRRNMSLTDLLPVTSRKNAAKHARRKNGANLAVGIAAGAAIGAVVGVLLAPKSGKETREDIKMKTEEVATKVKNKTSETFLKVKSKIKPNSEHAEVTEETTSEE